MPLQWTPGELETFCARLGKRSIWQKLASESMHARHPAQKVAGLIIATMDSAMLDIILYTVT